MVKSYDDEKKKHVVLYDDGDVEVLQLEKECWEVVDSVHKLSKKSKLMKTTPPKPALSNTHKKTKPVASLQQKSPVNITFLSKVRGKRTPRKNSNPESVKYSFKKVEAEKKVNPNILDLQPPTLSKSEDGKTDLLLMGAGQNIDTEEKLAITFPNYSELETSQSQSTHPSQELNGRRSPIEDKKSALDTSLHQKTSTSPDSCAAELPDNEPLGKWKRQSRERKRKH